jgi:hypothetical protein
VSPTNLWRRHLRHIFLVAVGVGVGLGRLCRVLCSEVQGPLVPDVQFLIGVLALLTCDIRYQIAGSILLGPTEAGSTIFKCNFSVVLVSRWPYGGLTR